MQRLIESISDWYDAQVDSASRIPYIGILVRAGLKGTKDLAKDMSASIAYFTFLSLFPMILGLFSIGGYFLESDEAQSRIVQFIGQVLPQSLDFVTRNIESLIRLRGVVGMASAVVLMWSASKMVAAISRGINNALGFDRPYAHYVSRLRNFGLMLTVAVLIFVTIAVTPLLGVINELPREFVDGDNDRILNLISSHAAGLALSAVLLSALYWLIPYQRLPWISLLPGIAVAAVCLEVGKDLFALYVGNLSRIDAVYGSVSSIIVLLVWLYFSARVLIFGTEVISVCRDSRLLHPTEQIDEKLEQRQE